MYAIVEAGGKQHKVEVNTVLKTELLHVNAGDKVNLMEQKFLQAKKQLKLALLQRQLKMAKIRKLLFLNISQKRTNAKNKVTDNLTQCLKY